MNKPFDEVEVKKGGFLLDNSNLCNQQFDKDKIEVFKEAIYLGYLDTCRTIKKTYNETIRSILEEDSKDNIAGILQDYFNEKSKDEKDFDDYHHSLCEKIKGKFGTKGIKLTYGQAQKIVNMSFKYLYCCNGIEEYDKYFKYCHMPLDSIILEWFWRKAKYSKTEHNIVRKQIGSWSNIVYEDNKSNEYSYMFYVKKIREFIGKDSCPFKEEFKIWKEMQKELVCEAFYFTFKPKANKEEFKGKRLGDKLKAVNEMLNELEDNR